MEVLLDSVPVVIYGFVIIIILLIAILFISLFSYDKILLQRYNAQELESGEYIHNIIKQLSTRAGIETPGLYSIESPAINSFSIATRKHTAVVITSTAIDKLNKEELEAIMAHELGHIRNSNPLGAFFTVLSSTLILPSSIALWCSMLTGFGMKHDPAPQFIRSYVLSMVGPPAAVIIQLCTFKSKEYAADAYSAKLCGTQVLINILKNLEGSDRIWEVNPTHIPLFFVNPVSNSIFDSLFNTHPSIEERIHRLEVVNK